MAVRFVVGRAGAGKTWRCLEAIRARLRERGDATTPDGPMAAAHKLLLIVPEQAGFQMERAIIETPDIAAFTRCEVLSFQRLAYRVFAEAGADPRRADQTIGALGRLMAMRRLIRQERSGLRLLGRVADKPGLIARVAGTIDELMREEVEPGRLAEVAAAMEPTDPLASAKLADIARLYQAYSDYLIGDRIDPAQYLQLAAERLAACTWLAGAEVWVDGFAGFTRQEYHLLAELARHAASVEVTMLVDPAASAVEATDLPAESYSRLARAERTLVRLRRELRSRGVAVDEPIRLRLPERTRFDRPALARLEASLFLTSPRPDTADVSPDVLRIVELPDRRAEVQAAVVEIQRLTREVDPPMRYRDIAIIVRDLATYHDLVSSAMQAHGIPCFVDQRQPTTHHPLVELVRSLLAVGVDNCPLDAVRLMLKTGLVPMAADDADLLENYLLAHGIEGRQRWAEPWAYTRYFRHKGEKQELSELQKVTLARVNTLRERWLSLVGPWLQTAARGEVLPGQAWAEAMYACLDRMGAGGRLHAWAEQAEADGRTELADTHRQVWLDFVELLDEFVRALGSEQMTSTEFRETLQAGLAEFTLGLAPPTLDQVLVGAIERSRHPSIRAALLLGLDEAHYPMRRQEDPLLGDAEREALQAADAEVGVSRRQRLVDERMLAYIALTRASERVWISYPRREVDGKPLQPSAFLQDIVRVLPGVPYDRVDDVAMQTSAAFISSVGQLGGRLATVLRDRPKLAEEKRPDIRGRWNALYDAAQRREDWRYTLRRSMAGLAYENTAHVAQDLIARMVDEPFKASVSRLESFAACPFKHFAEYWLRLDQRIEADLGEADLGTMCHAILERFMFDLVRDKQQLADLADDEIAERVDRIARETLPALQPELILTDPRAAYLYDRSRGHLSRITRWQRDFARRGRFRPAAVEFPFGYEPRTAMVLTTPKGRQVHLRGRIDRVDVAELTDDLLGTVIDYKRTTLRQLNLAGVYHGLALQLVTYMLALRRVGATLAGRAIRPVAAFYLPLLEPYQSTSHPDEEKRGSFRCRGIVDADAATMLDNELGPGSASRYLNARMTTKGEPYKNCDLAASDRLSALMRHVERRMGELADALLDGVIDVAPYRLNRQTPCGYCPYQSVCRFEPTTQPARYLPSMSGSEVLDRVMEEAP